MIHLLVAAQLLAPSPRPAYASPELQALVARAADQNRNVPLSLMSYRARVESEIAVLTRRADGEENAVSLEQAQNAVHWQRSGRFEQHVNGYRARLSGPSLSALAFVRNAWTIPVLYGNRLSLFFGDRGVAGKMREDLDGEGASAPASTRDRTPLAVHPFAARRDRVYTFDGGDTVAVIRTSQRAIPIVRVQVEPRAEQPDWPVVVFRGEIDLDADRGEIVRMRGRFVTLGRSGPQKQRLLVVPVNVMAYVDLESVEVDGRYWLPRYQRIETHVDMPGLAEGRSVFRIVSRFRDHAVSGRDEPNATAAEGRAERGEPASTVEPPWSTPGHHLTLAGRDSLQQPREWWQPLGEATAGLRGDDFADVEDGPAAPGAATLAWRARRLADLVHFNRVEGWTTGAAVEVAPGARWPGLTLRANAGWAWTEQSLRGRLEVLRTDATGAWTTGARIGRTLDLTNDFTMPHDSGSPFLPALAGVDDHDYVDRAAASLWIGVNLVPRLATLRVETGVARDFGTVARLTTGPLGGDTPFRPNRGLDHGMYARAGLVAEWNPRVNGNALASGLGAHLRYEAAAGQLTWQRATLQVTARREVGDFALAMRVDGGTLVSRNAPPQQLFELGGGSGLPGFAYKAFAGDRAVVTRWRAAYRLPLLQSPLRLGGCTCITAPAPAFTVTLHNARVSASSAATMASIARLGSVGDRIGYAPARPGDGIPVSSPTAGWRTSLEVGLRFFGGAVTLGAARVAERGAPWRATFTIGQAW